MDELLTIENLKVGAALIQALIILIGVLIHLKKGNVDAAADMIEGVFEQAVSIGRNSKNGSDASGQHLKAMAIAFAKDKLLEDKRVIKALGVLNITPTDAVVEHYIDVAFHAGKLGLKNTLKKVVKTESI